MRTAGKYIAIGATVMMITVIALCVMHQQWDNIAPVLASWVFLVTVGMLIGGEPKYEKGAVEHVVEQLDAR